MREWKAAAQPLQQRPMHAMRLAAISVFVVAVAAASPSARAQEHHRPGGPDIMMFGDSPEHIGRTVDHMLDGLNATDAQRTQIKQIAASASADVKAQRDSDRRLRDKGMQIFSAPSVDASAAETVRVQLGALHDQGSKRMLQAMLDVAKVLTPEQRAKIGERMQERQAIAQDRMQRMRAERPQHAPRPAPAQ